MESLPTSREEAKKIGAKHFFTGVPCKNGHVDKIQTAGICRQCHLKMVAAWSSKNPVKRAKIARKYQTNSIDKNRKKAREWAHRNPNRYLIRKGFLGKASPQWLTDEQRKDITDKYDEARQLTISTGIQHEVDHEVPLVSDEVCGLHVPWNLRVITMGENRRKSNKLLVWEK